MNDNCRNIEPIKDFTCTPVDDIVKVAVIENSVLYVNGVKNGIVTKHDKKNGVIEFEWGIGNKYLDGQKGTINYSIK